MRPLPRLVLVAVPLLIACDTLSSQTIVTLPRGYETMGGGRGNGTGVPYPFDRGVFHYMEVHTTWRGQSRVLTNARFRRAWNYASNTTAVKRTAVVTLNVGDGDNTKFTTTFSTNFIGGKFTTVFPTTTVNMPDWTTKTGLMPDVWTLTLPFTTKFVHTGKADFVWEIFYDKPSVTTTSTGYQADRSSSYGNNTSSPRQSDYITYGTGCTATGRTSAMSNRLVFYNAGSTNPMQLQVTATNNPSSQSLTLAVGFQSANLTIPGWCTQVFVNPLIFLPLGTTNSSGVLPGSPVTVNFPYTASGIYVPVFTQTFAKDPGLLGGIALSNGDAAFMPRPPGDYIFRYTYSTSVTSTTGSGPFTAGSVITGWN
jgi:hypothetical protein